MRGAFLCIGQLWCEVSNKSVGRQCLLALRKSREKKKTYVCLCIDEVDVQGV